MVERISDGQMAGSGLVGYSRRGSSESGMSSAYGGTVLGSRVVEDRWSRGLGDANRVEICVEGEG